MIRSKPDVRAGRRPRTWFVLGGLVIVDSGGLTGQKNPTMLAAGLVGADHGPDLLAQREVSDDEVPVA